MARNWGPYDTAAHQRLLWTPAALRGVAKLVAWWDAFDLSTVNAASNVITAWRDKSGSGNNLANFGNPAWSPIGWKAVTQIGPSTVWAAGSDKMFGASIAYTAGNGQSAFAVVQNSGAATTRTIFNGTAGSFQFRLSSSNKLEIIRTQQAAIFASTATIPTGFVQVGADVGTNRSDVWINGTLETNSTNPAFSDVILGLGLNAGSNGEPFDSAIAEVIITSFFLSSYETALVQGYLAWKWGMVSSLPAAHLYKYSPPLLSAGIPRLRQPWGTDAVAAAGAATRVRLPLLGVN